MLCGDRGGKRGKEGPGDTFCTSSALILRGEGGKAVNGRVGQAVLFLLIKFPREQI